MAKKKSKKVNDAPGTPEVPAEVTDVHQMNTDEEEETFLPENIEHLTPVERKTKWQKFKRAVSRKMSGKKTKKGTEVKEVNIVQEDETDYEKQWSRKMDRRPRTAGWNDVESAEDSLRGSSPAKEDASDLPEDGIIVIHDAEDDDEL